MLALAVGLALETPNAAGLARAVDPGCLLPRAIRLLGQSSPVAARFELFMHLRMQLVIHLEV